MKYFFISKDLRSVEHTFIAITLRSTFNWSRSTPSMSQKDLFENIFFIR